MTQKNKCKMAKKKKSQSIATPEHSRDSNGTPFLVAILKTPFDNDGKIFKYLLRSGADPNLKDAKGESAPFLLLRHSYYKFIFFILCMCFLVAYIFLFFCFHIFYICHGHCAVCRSIIVLQACVFVYVCVCVCVVCVCCLQSNHVQ